MLQRQNSGEDLQFRNQLIANAAAHGLDSASFDAAMQDAVKRGAPEAGQFIHRYTPLLQQRLIGAYGAAPSGGGAAASQLSGAAGGGGGAAPSTDDLNRQYANSTPQQMADILQKWTAIGSAMSGANEQNYPQVIAQLAQSGIPNAAQLAGPYNPLNVVRLYNLAQQKMQYLQGRVAESAAGGPNPQVPIETIGTGEDIANKYTGQRILPPKWAVTDTTDAFGQKTPVAYDPLDPTRSVTIRPAAPADSSPFAAFAKQMDGAENSTGNAAAKNPLSSATGNGQFINSTWLNMVKEARPDLAKGLSDSQILALRSDPTLSAQMTEQYARDNASALSKDGLPVTTATLALAHRFGPDGAAKFLNSTFNTPMSQVFGKDVIAANPSLAHMTVGQYTHQIAGQFGNTPMQAPPSTPSLANFDSSKVDSSLTGWDYASQFPAEVQDAAKAYMGGGVMPSGNSRSQGITSMAKMVAQKVANDLGRPELADDTLYPQRRQMQVELAKTTAPQALGGQITFGGTALGHLATYAEDLADLHNDSGGITPLGHLANRIGSLSNAQSEKINQASGDAQHYGQEITKFYGGGPGGQAERDRFLSASNSTNPATATPQELAGMIRSERNLIPERYAQIKANIENVLGPEAAAKAIARINIPPQMDRINKALATLDPTGPEAQALKAGATPALAAAAPSGPSPQDAVALSWAKANPKDPRAAQIMAHLGAQ